MDFKFNFNTSQTKAIEEKFRRDVTDILRQQAFMKEVGDMTVERLRFQARTENPFNEKSDFPFLKDSTIKNRQYLARHNDTHETFAVRRSNVTITGQLLNALTWVVEGPGRIKFFFQGMHQPYRGKNGQPIGKAIANSDLAKWLFQKGFKIFDSSIGENKTLKARINTIVKQYLRRGLRVRGQVK